MQFNGKTLERLVELSNGFLLIDSFKALQALDLRAGDFRDGIGKLGLATSGWSLKQNWFIQFCCEVNGCRGDFIGDVAGAKKPGVNVTKRRKQVCSLTPARFDCVQKRGTSYAHSEIGRASCRERV